MNSTKDISAKRLHLSAAGAPIAALCLLSACAPVTPHFDARFGDSVRLAIAQQTANPDASRNMDPVSGIDGRAANEAMKRYQDSFREPPPPPPLIQIGNTGGGQ